MCHMARSDEILNDFLTQKEMNKGRKQQVWFNDVGLVDEANDDVRIGISYLKEPRVQTRTEQNRTGR